jgi:hypothetical protein
MRRVRWRLWFLGLPASLALCAAAPSAFAQPAQIEGVSRVYLRAGPGPDQRILSTLNVGDHVKVLANDGFWAKVETPSGTVGYVFNRYLGTARSAGTPAPAIRPSPPVVEAAATPSTPVMPTPAVEPATPKDDLAAEVAALRSEISDLKEKVQRAPETEGRGGETGAPTSSPTAADATAGRSAHEQNTEVLAVGLLALIIGLAIGASLARRRSRSHRPRLRF